MKNVTLFISYLYGMNQMYEFGGGDVFIILFIAIVLGAGIYTLVRFRKNRNF